MPRRRPPAGRVALRTRDKERIMFYDLPTGPDIHLVGPDDTPWWTALGVDPAGRHALVIGDPTAPAGAVVIAAALPDIGAYLHPLHAALIAAVGQEYARTQRNPGRDERRELTAPPPPPTTPPAAVDLVTLPHTGIRVPDPKLRVWSYRDLPTPDGVAYTATLRLGRTPVGTIHNEGTGGLTGYHPAAGSPFGHRRLADFVVASRTADGQPISEESLLEELVTEYENSRHVAAATRVGRSPVRLMAPLVDGDHLADVYYTAHRTTAAKVTTPVQRDALVAALRQRAVVDGGWWQLWTGEQWDNLTAPQSERQQPTP
jgi:hypothetical protein